MITYEKLEEQILTKTQYDTLVANNELVQGCTYHIKDILIQTLTDAESISWDMNLGSIAQVTLEGSRTLATPINIEAGSKYVLKITQDAAGSRTLTYSADFRFTGGIVPVLTSTANAVDIIEFISFDGETLTLTNFLPDLKAV